MEDEQRGFKQRVSKNNAWMREVPFFYKSTEESSVTIRPLLEDKVEVFFLKKDSTFRRNTNLKGQLSLSCKERERDKDR